MVGRAANELPQGDLFDASAIASASNKMPCGVKNCQPTVREFHPSAGETRAQLSVALETSSDPVADCAGADGLTGSAGFEVLRDSGLDASSAFGVAEVVQEQ